MLQLDDDGVEGLVAGVLGLVGDGGSVTCLSCCTGHVFRLAVRHMERHFSAGQVHDRTRGMAVHDGFLVCAIVHVQDTHIRVILHYFVVLGVHLSCVLGGGDPYNG